jgi:ABC-type branched-subunit amino acid transport system ATPase component
LINVVCGVYQPVSGRAILEGRSLEGIEPHQTIGRGLARTFQDVRIFPFLTARENVLVAMPSQRGERVRHLSWPGRSIATEEKDNRARADALLAEMALTAVADRPAGELPFGQQKLIALLRAVATGAKYLLLDEPAAGVELDILPRITGIIRRLVKEEGRGALLIEHNVDVVREVADHVSVLQGGGVIASGPCDTVLRDPTVIKEYLGRIYDA